MQIEQLATINLDLVLFVILVQWNAWRYPVGNQNLWIEGKCNGQKNKDKSALICIKKCLKIPKEKSKTVH